MTKCQYCGDQTDQLDHIEVVRIKDGEKEAEFYCHEDCLMRDYA